MVPPEKHSLVSAWLAKAGSDMGAAHSLILGMDRHLDAGVYHCQQAAEKSLKAILTFHDIPFPKTHNLTELLIACHAAAPSAEKFLEYANLLTPYATEFRYPGDVFEPSIEDAKVALTMANEFLSYAREILQERLDVKQKD